jgi:hypothetical protein
MKWRVGALHFSAHEAGIVSLQVSSDGEVISDAVIFEYKSLPTSNNKNDVESVTENVAKNDDNDDDDDDSSLVWECGNVCNSYLCETETCRRALRMTLLQRMEELETRLTELDLRQEKKVRTT